jgi:hypothetical protein
MENQFCFIFWLVDLLPDEHQKQPKSTKNACFNQTDELSRSSKSCQELNPNILPQ